MRLISITPDYMSVLKTAAGQCYQQTLNGTAIQNIIESGHLSVLEHCTATFEMQCSTSVLLQLTRHRHLSFTVQSSRGSKLSTLSATGDEDIEICTDIAMNNYDEMLQMGKAHEQAAYLLPRAVKVSLVVTGNFRAWFEYLPKRLCSRALPEHRQIASSIHELLAQAAPEVFDRDMMNCEKCTERSCSFK